MMYVITLNNVEYGIELTDTLAEIKECATTEKSNDLVESFDDIPDLFDDVEDESLDSCNILAVMPGVIISILKEDGSEVKEGEPLVIYESMKMESEILSTCNGHIEKSYIKKGDKISIGQKLFTIT